MQMEPVTVLRIVRRSLLNRGINSIATLRDSFRILNDDACATVTLRDFATGLIDLDIYVGREQLKMVFSEFDKDGSGSIEIDEFLAAITPPIPTTRLDVIKLCFTKIDKDGSGVITADDITGVWSVASHPKYKSGEWTEKQCLEDYLNVWEKPGTEDTKVTVTEFVDYYTIFSATIDDDQYFDWIMRGTFNL